MDLHNPTVVAMIKSSRRPWALDRAIASMREHILDYEQVKVFLVDDRTDPRFLDAIKVKYPEVEIWGGDYASQPPHLSKDSKFVQNWRAFVESTSADYVFVLEDDQWLSAPLAILGLASLMKRESIVATQLVIPSKEIPGAVSIPSQSDGWDFYLPNILRVFEQPTITNFPLRMWVKFVSSPSLLARKAFGALCLAFKGLDRRAWIPIAMANPIAGALFHREYWLTLWSPGQSKINENLQISRAIEFIASQESGLQVLAAGQKSFFRTTYVSSISLDLGLAIDWPVLNSIWSECWLNGDLPYPSNLEDWSETKLANLLESKGVESKIYLQWVSKFKLMHRSQ